MIGKGKTMLLLVNSIVKISTMCWLTEHKKLVDHNAF